MTDLQPDTHEVLQEEPYVMAVSGSVSVAGPVRTQALPRKSGATRTRTVTDAGATQVLTADPRRASAVIVGDEAIYIGYGVASKEDLGAMSLWPANTPFVCTAVVDVFVRSASQDGNTRVSITTEMWAAGEAA